MVVEKEIVHFHGLLSSLSHSAIDLSGGQADLSGSKREVDSSLEPAGAGEGDDGINKV